MGTVHAKNTVLILNGTDLSLFSNNSEWERSADEHDVTTYGKNDHVFEGGLGLGKSTLNGVYDNTLSGPRAVIEPLVGTKVPLIERPEGTGTGKPQRAVDVLVKSYKESKPVADMVMWSAELTHSDALTRTTQS